MQLPLTLLFAFSKPAKAMTQYLINSNMLDKKNHLIYWITAVIYSMGLVVSYVFYVNSSDFQPNIQRQIRIGVGWYGCTKSGTVNFITICLAYILLPFSIYRSSPWKMSILKNTLMIVLISINLLLLLPISLLTQNLGLMGIQSIGLK